ncbi:sugar O-acyltransferase, sialic acid O-acetyltransferase NeuD family [Hymenobacter daecheongensis DSM 21074]|uniref:Sugar O-acyltransferase, sialic acid O-acetyltransferase NeuD family n=1 Tax=Hymenobacter daecheongensis DSM 21074 TaxID=1121955 RepID=A0A1M6GG60_9BACT|nr:acetyltransferase [Hymenobacter daecheongensis]SHJ08940.1 sugar O-acyltransferase, sialic acid O-acetyltransferase NeuD family [Hymenobacter daecheongensis DSM 21074]
MVIVGAKGFAKEVLEIFSQQQDLEGIYFYDDVSQDLPEALYGRFPVLKTPADAARIFAQDPRFVLGVGNPKVRRKLAQKMTELGGQLCSSVSPHAFIGAFNNTIGTGVNIMTGSILTNDVVVGEGVLINLNCTVGHDNVLGDYCELSPGVHLSGNVTIGKEVVIGTGAVLLPGVSIGDNSIIGAGSVVNRDVESNVIAVGIPAKVIKTLS